MIVVNTAEEQSISTDSSELVIKNINKSSTGEYAQTIDFNQLTMLLIDILDRLDDLEGA